jgi:hypothetical protein
MKKTIVYSVILLCSIVFFACNDEWKDEQYEKYVSFVNSGYTNTYLRYDSQGGRMTYKIPIVISGSTFNDKDVTVRVALDPDTLDALNEARFRSRTDLYFKILEPQFYHFPTMETTIPAGSDVAYLNVEFEIKDLNLVDKYILPLQIESTSEYIPSPKKWYRKSLMRIIPFNDYSGTYSATAGNIYEGTSTTAIVLESREMKIVNEKAVFFYAGLTEEEARDRALYKIIATFNDDNSVTLAADSAAIGFKYTPADCKYKIESRMDELQPYLEIRTLTLTLKYSYNDLTNRDHPIPYRFEGSYLMERRRNTQIPDEDQPEIFE